ADINVGGVRADRIAGDDDAFDDLVRVPLDELAVLERPGLALVRVAAEIFGQARVFGNEVPLRARWETGSAPSPEAGLFHNIDHGLGRVLLEHLLDRFVAALFFIILEAAGVVRRHHVFKQYQIPALHRVGVSVYRDLE